MALLISTFSLFPHLAVTNGPKTLNKTRVSAVKKSNGVSVSNKPVNVKMTEASVQDYTEVHLYIKLAVSPRRADGGSKTEQNGQYGFA